MPGIVHVIVFSNFEGFELDEPRAQNAIQWFDASSAAHPDVKWTHLYDPRHLLVGAAGLSVPEGIFSPYLLSVQDSGMAEIGIHMHMYYDLVLAMGVDPVSTPSGADSSPECDSPDPTGYGALLTGYSVAARSAILDAAISSFQSRGFHPPKTFCAGYSAADPELQAMLASKGFTTSFAAQPVSPFAPLPGNYPNCWHRLLEWSGHITPLTIPYRVNRHSVLPPPHDNREYLELVEIPLNMWVDEYALYIGHDQVSREDMFDRHYDWARDTGNETAVAIGVHTDIISEHDLASEEWGTGRVSKVIDDFLNYVEQRALEGGVEIRYGTSSEVAERFWENKTIGHVGGDKQMATGDCLTGVCNPQRTQGLKAPAPRGEHVLMALKGPGLFLGAQVTKQGGATGNTLVILDIDGRNVTNISYATAQKSGLTQQNPYGVVLLESATLENLTIGFPSPLRFLSDLKLSVKVSEAGVAKIIGNVIHGQ